LLLDPSSAHEGDNMIKTTPMQNKALVLQAFDTLFNKRDYEAAERYWSDKYIQHGAHIQPGREGLFWLIRSLPDSLRYEHDLILAEATVAFRAPDDRPHGWPPTWCGSRTASWPSIGTYSMTRRPEPKSGLPMFGDRFPA
jgi:hypothetical protein